MSTEKKPRTKGGKGLTSRMAELGYRPRELVRLTGTSPQVVYGWMHRGVSARYSYKVAEILQCQASDISDSLAATEIAEPQLKTRNHVPTSMSFAPIIPWKSAASSLEARDHSNEWAACVLMDELPYGCFALVAAYAPGVTIQESSGMTAVLFVDPIIDPACRSQYGHIVKTPSADLPLHRKIRNHGGDSLLVGMDPECPVPPQPLTPDCMIIGTVVSVGIAKSSPFPFP